MFFWTLLFAHVIGDFPLQTDAIYRVKTKYWWGVVPHVLICTVMNILVLVPFLNTKNAWWGIAFLGLIHIVLDRTKISVSEKIARDNFFQFFLDQLLHVLSIWLAALWLSNTIDVNSYELTGFFTNRALVIQTTALIFAAFGGVPIIFYAQKFWALEVKKQKTTVVYPPLLKRVTGYFERFLATLGIIWGGWWLLLPIVAFLPRLVLNWQESDREQIFVGSVTGLIVSIVCGVIAVLLT